MRVFREAGLPIPRVFVSGLSERSAVELRSADAPISGVLLAGDAPVVGARVAHYELVAIEERERWVPRASARQAAVAPGRKLVLRYFDAQERPVADVAHLPNERLLQAQGGSFVDARTARTLRLSAASGAPLRAGAMRGGKRVCPPEALLAVRERAARSVASLSEACKRMGTPMAYPFGISPQLAALRQELLSSGGRPVTPS